MEFCYNFENKLATPWPKKKKTIRRKRQTYSLEVRGYNHQPKRTIRSFKITLLVKTEMLLLVL